MKSGQKPRPPPVLLASLLLLGVLTLGGSLLLFGSNPQRPAPAAGPFQYTGPGSCSSVSCHGSVQARQDTRVLQNEYSLWVVQDKHAKAFTVLSNPVSERMARILGLPQADTAPKCLACHALNVPPERRGRTFDLSDGVSCENCHGPAASWLGAHTTRDWTHEQSLQQGMYDTKDLVKRTEKCLACHLGDEEKSVGHEMIAAGHPDLTFELDSFSAVMPRHWKEPLDKDPWVGARTWGVGQVVQLREALKRLARRARTEVWPDYGEMQCYACHHNLTTPEQSWRQARGYPRRRPGDPPWNTSRYAVFRHLVGQVDRETAERLETELNQLAGLMSRLVPDRNEVAATARRSAELADLVTRQIAARPFDRTLTLRLLQAITADADNIAGRGERAAEQAAMALDSLFIAYARNVRVENEKEARAAINALFQQLENPSAYNPARFAAQMHELNVLLR